MNLVLDFDGVICNSIDECLVVSYNAYHSTQITDVDLIDEQFKSFFYKYRHYVRPAKEYYVLYYLFHQNIFELNYTVFQDISTSHSEMLASFELEFFDIRSKLKRNLESWCSMHSIYTQVTDFLGTTTDTFDILSTKDSDSIEKLCEYFGLREFIGRIYSREISENKAILFEQYFKDHPNIFPSDVIFVDDNEYHLESVQGFEICLYFASWGYSKRQVFNSFPELNDFSVLNI